MKKQVVRPVRSSTQWFAALAVQWGLSSEWLFGLFYKAYKGQHWTLFRP